MNSITPISDTDDIFARAYADAIKTKFQIDVGEHFVVLISPVTQRGMAAGDLIYPQMTNYLIYKFADALQYSDNPCYTGGSAGSYIQQLRSNPSSATAIRMANARNTATAANANYFQVQSQALAQFNQVKELYPNQTFWQWASENYPPLAAAEMTRQAAQAQLYQAMEAYFGPDAITLSNYVNNITNAHSSNAFPGYNMEGLIDDEDLIAQAIKFANTGGSPAEMPDIQPDIIRVPAYSIATYVSSVQAWIDASGHGATRSQEISIDINKGPSTKWEDYGFRAVHGGGGGGFWPFFHAEVFSNNQWVVRTLNTSGRESDVSVQLAMIGIQKFDIRPGEWDVPNIKALFPKRLPTAPDVLSSKYAQVISILVGYDVQLNVKFGSSMRDEVNRIYEEVKSTGGWMSVFGFRVSAGKDAGLTDQVVTNFHDVQWDQSTGSMSLTPTAGQVYPTILAAVAQRFD
ncbi:hypothetical protein H0H92_007484 [Tricholoma furcatifolium]|nr:hypothetical protein H0H92_007484 [Tricholoma furcatifolium]